VSCTGEERYMLKHFVGKTEENKTLAIPRSRRRNNIKKDLNRNGIRVYRAW
jgi:hypothetical protein